MTDKRVLNLIKEEAIIIVNFRKGNNNIAIYSLKKSIA